LLALILELQKFKLIPIASRPRAFELICKRWRRNDREPDAIIVERPPKCDKGYVMINGKCSAKDSNTQAFCICNGLLAAVESNSNPLERPLYTIGANAPSHQGHIVCKGFDE